MKSLFTIVLLFVSLPSIDEIAKVNKLKEEAKQAYESGNYEKSAQTYSYLVDTLSIEDDNAVMNMANAYYQMEDKEKALASYQRLQDSEINEVRSQAYQQLGVLSKDPKTLQNALAYFKESIKSDPTNDDSRYNYELIKKKLQEQENQEGDQNQENQDDQEKDENKEDQEQKNEDQKGQNDENQEGEGEEKEEQQSEDQQNQEGEQQEQEGDEQESEQQEQQGEEGEPENPEEQEGQSQENEGEEESQPPQKSTSEKLQEMNLSEEKAKMILEALKNSEIQYIQQQKRKPKKKKDSDKPDW